MKNDSSSRSAIRFGLYLPDFGKESTPQTYVELAREAEKAGWDGFFLWDHLVEGYERVPLFDSFTLLAAIAQATRRIKIGTTVTPLPRSKPWNIARRVATLDNLSNGRVILGVGLGAEESVDYERFGEIADPRILAEKLDESLEIINGLWSGKPFSYEEGKHFRILQKTTFLPPPVQKPRVPIWVAGTWPHKRPFRRAARWDGTIPLKGVSDLVEPSDLDSIVSFIRTHRDDSSEKFDIAVIGWTTGKNRVANSKKVSRYAKAGATWWLEGLYTHADSVDRMTQRIKLGPPI
jgi:hypothetical protein